MQLTQTVRRLGRNDVRLFGRDTFLIGMTIYGLAIGVVLRFLLPWADNYFVEHGVLSFSLQDYYPLLVGFMAFFEGALFSGIIIGFMLLEEKDDNTIKAMLVTPLPFQTYVGYRVVVTMVIGFALILAEVLLINLVIPPLLPLLLITASAMLTGPISGLFFATFAENKVQGFALTKFTGVAGLLILVAWFVPEPFQFIFGLFPPYWVNKAYWMIIEGQSLWWVAVILAVVLQTGVIAFLIRRFNKVAYT